MINEIFLIENVIKVHKASAVFGEIKTSLTLKLIKSDIKQITARIDRRFNELTAELNRMEENNAIKNFRAANEAFKAYLVNGMLNDANIQTLKGLYLPNTGLPLDERTGNISNNDIVAFSYLGLICLEKITTNNESLISWYILRMFEACPRMANEYFPEFYEEYYKESVESYDRVHYDLVSELMQMRNIKPEHLSFLIKYYDIHVQIDDWAEGSKNRAQKALGWMLNKTIGPVYITPESCIRLLELTVKLNADALTYMFYIIAGMICQRCRSKFLEEKYREKRQTEMVRYLSRRYLQSKEYAFLQETLPDEN